jgi:hypothetical protein
MNNKRKMKKKFKKKKKKKNPSQKQAGGVAQGEDSEFKPQYSKKNPYARLECTSVGRTLA